MCLCGLWKMSGRRGAGEFYICIFNSVMCLLSVCVCRCVQSLLISWTSQLIVWSCPSRVAKSQKTSCSEMLSANQIVTKHCLTCERARSYSGLFWCICVSKETTSFGVSPSFSTQIGVTVALLTTIIGVISVNQTWAQEWDVIPISLQVSRLKSP